MDAPSRNDADDDPFGDGDDAAPPPRSLRERRRHHHCSGSAGPSSDRQRRSLLAGAGSHGPYLWTDRDVENALRWWFSGDDDGGDAGSGGREGDGTGGPTAPEGAEGAAEEAPPCVGGKGRPSGGGERGGACGGDDGNDNDGDGGGPRAFLRLLLQSPGILDPRPERRKRSSRKRRRLGLCASLDPPLRSVLLGYARLAAASRAVGGEEGGNVAASSESYEVYCSSGKEPREDGDENGAVPRKTEGVAASGAGGAEATSAAPSVAASPTPLRHLRDDLLSIVCARLRTEELYRLAFSRAEAAAGGGGDNDDPSPRRSRKPKPRALRTLDESDAYFAHPDTAVRLSYASSLYDRLLELDAGQEPEREAPQSAGGAKRGEGGGSPADKFLSKLRILASTDRRIREVLVLMLLEPVRRLGREDADEGGVPTRSVAAAAAAAGEDRLDATSRSRPCGRLRDAVLRLAREEALEGKTGGGDREGGGGGGVWSLPSPLLCAASHVHLPVARAYTQNLIDAAVQSRVGLPGEMARRVAEALLRTGRGDEEKESGAKDVPEGCSKEGGGGTEEDDSMVGFDGAISRLLDAAATSDRLSVLVSDLLLENPAVPTGERCDVPSGEDHVASQDYNIALDVVRKRVLGWQ